MVPRDDLAHLVTALEGRILFPGNDGFAEATLA